MMRDLHHKGWAKTAIARETGDKIVLFINDFITHYVFLALWPYDALCMILRIIQEILLSCIRLGSSF
ncbi:hypothetical protein ACP2W0_08810 [Pseudobacillus badius]|uniref:hypothetical protein n=1 Tax=Bacillus badius TaxID=1455 RepID=UPI003CEF62CE